MMSTSVMGHFSSDSNRDPSPDNLSPLYPDRPIKPLPKRRLKERLSPDVAESIRYPPAPPTTTPLFYYPYSLNGEEDRPRGEQYQIDRQRADEIERNYISRRIANVHEQDSEEEYLELASRARHPRQSSEQSPSAFRYVQKPDSLHYRPEPPASITSSADGYDSFENTNNKKKRKIPTPGDVALNGLHLSNDLASLGISQPNEDSLSQEDVVHASQCYSPPNTHFSGQGLSGPGRGRYGRTRNGRSPLRALSDVSNYANGRTPRSRAQWSGEYYQQAFDRQPHLGTSTESAGIISTAIANAEKLPATSLGGQENVSLIQQAAKKSSPASAQFTFTCDSQVPGIVAWPGPQLNTPPYFNNQTRRIMASHGTQTHAATLSADQQDRSMVDMSHATQKANGKMSTPLKKSRRRSGKEYLVAARQRREQQEYQNYHHPVPQEERWICEFCEYERIFGSPPEALIKQYEIKDRQIRKQEAERRRLLEKAKMKGRKGKKGGKTPGRNMPAVQTQHSQHAHLPTDHHNNLGTQSEEYYDDDYEEEYVHEGDLPQIPSNPPTSKFRGSDVTDPPKHPARAGDGDHGQYQVT